MPNYGQKTPIARTLEAWGLRKAQSAIDLLGAALPASVVKVVSSGIVTVKFELQNVPFTLPQITVPIEGSEYIRLPIQQGMKGWVKPSDAYLGGMSGLGGGIADLTPRPNLSNLVFSPIGNTAWSAADDPNAVVIYGPDGVIIRDAKSKNVLTWRQDGVTFNLTAGSLTITIPTGQLMTINGNVQINGNLQLGGVIEGLTGGGYSGDIKTGGNVIAGVGGSDQVGLQTHTHQYQQPTGPSTPQQTVKPTANT